MLVFWGKYKGIQNVHLVIGGWCEENKGEMGLKK
jgi:hypothetical protein